MQIDQLNLEGLGCFNETGWITLGPCMNFIVGQNNSGKSILLNSIKDLPDNRYRSEQEFRKERLPVPKQSARVIFEGLEIEVALTQVGSIFWPVKPDGPNVLENTIQEVREFLSQLSCSFRLYRSPGGEFKIEEGLPYGNNGILTQVYFQQGGELVANGQMSGPEPGLPSLLTRIWTAKVFLFNAQRYNIGNCAIGQPPLLYPDARNLPAVLLRLSGDNGDSFRELTQHMCDIFPSVKNLSVTIGDNGQDVEIRVWPTREQRHRELSASLNQCGTGLSQVLAILTIAMTFEKSVIVIDEISSFLHPAASKALVRILESHYPNHQYIASTHSSEVMSACAPSTVHLVRKGGYTSTVSSIDPKSVVDLRTITRELGVSLTDVFAADRIVWVEGPTEEASFAYIFEETRDQLPQDVAAQAPQFTAVVATGDFSRKRNRAELIFEIYSRLTEAAAPIANSTVFAFDAELLTNDQMTDLKKRSPNPVEFLPRRLYECFLLSPIAITKVLNRQTGISVAVNQIETMI